MSRPQWGWLACLTVLAATEASAQGLVLRLPADGTWVRYEGTYTQSEIRPDSATGKLEIPAWREQVTIKSVGTETAEFRGEMVPCRWIEVKVERGREAEGKIDVGVTGLELYKVLVPEAAVTAVPASQDGIPNSFLPIVKGVRKFGQSDPQPISEPALRLYPLAILFGYCRDLQKEEKGVDPGIGLGAVSADMLTGSSVLERKSSRTQLDMKIWSSADVPFGVAAWTAKITRQIKDAQEPRENFRSITEVVVELKAQRTGADATSELNAN
jgi:hypothetical protein